MEVHEFGKQNRKKTVLIPGNMMTWRQFENVIPLLSEKYHVIAISIDGYDGRGTVFTTAEAAAEKLEEYIRDHLDGEIELVFGESFGSAVAGLLFYRQNVKVNSLIMSGPQYMNIPVLEKLLAFIIPRNQFRLLAGMKDRNRLPWLLKLYTGSDDNKLLRQFEYAAQDISLETLQNAMKEALILYDKIDSFDPRPDAKVAIWYGEKEPNMKKAVEKLTRAFPEAQDHPFKGIGHGEIMSEPVLMAEEIIKFVDGEEI